MDVDKWLVGNESADLWRISFWFWANCAWMCGWRFLASMRCLRRLKVCVINLIWYLKSVAISCWSRCISLRSLRSVTYSLVTSDTDSRRFITHSLSTSTSGFFIGSGRMFFSTFPNFEANVSNWLFAVSTYKSYKHLINCLW